MTEYKTELSKLYHDDIDKYVKLYKEIKKLVCEDLIEIFQQELWEGKSTEEDIMRNIFIEEIMPETDFSDWEEVCMEWVKIGLCDICGDTVYEHQNYTIDPTEHLICEDCEEGN